MRGKLDRVNFRKDFWDFDEGKVALKGGAHPVTIPETIAGHISAPVPISFLKLRNDDHEVARENCLKFFTLKQLHSTIVLSRIAHVRYIKILT